jgi:hypothetical protein
MPVSQRNTVQASQQLRGLCLARWTVCGVYDNDMPDAPPPVADLDLRLVRYFVAVPKGFLVHT